MHPNSSTLYSTGPGGILPHVNDPLLSHYFHSSVAPVLMGVSSTQQQSHSHESHNLPPPPPPLPPPPPPPHHHHHQLHQPQATFVTLSSSPTTYFHGGNNNGGGINVPCTPSSITATTAGAPAYSNGIMDLSRAYAEFVELSPTQQQHILAANFSNLNGIFSLQTSADHYNNTAEVVSHKKVKLERGTFEEGNKSAVLFIRNLPVDASENDVVLLAIPFGIVQNVILARKSQQALLELDKCDNGLAMVTHYNRYPFIMGGCEIEIRFSKHLRLEMKMSNPNTRNLLENARQMTTFYQANATKRVLRVIIDNARTQALTHIVIYRIFSRFGKVLKVVIFSRNAQFHALVEFGEVYCAHVAKLTLDNTSLYADHGNVRVDFSKMESLDVKMDNGKGRDFERLPLSIEEQAAVDYYMSTMAFPLQNSYLTNQDLVTSANLFPATFLPNTSTIFMPPTYDSIDCLNQSMFMQQMMMNCIQQQQHAQSQDNFSALNNTSQINIKSNVLLISNLNDERANPDGLYALFSIYGDISRVKILYNKKDTALIQFDEVKGAQRAMACLHNQVIWGKSMKITLSKHSEVQMPHDVTDLTKDYTQDQYRRSSTVVQNCLQSVPTCPLPCQHLIIALSPLEENHSPSDIPTSSNLQQHLEINHFNQVISLNRKVMSDGNEANDLFIVNMMNTEQAISVLITLHNTLFNEKFLMFLTFADEPQNKSG